MIDIYAHPETAKLVRAGDDDTWILFGDGLHVRLDLLPADLKARLIEAMEARE